MESVKASLLSATLRILKPLVRILMRFEISHGEFSELAKQAYIEVAHNDFAIASRKTTTSRVAVLTGLSRKEVVRVTKLLEENALPLDKVPANRASRVVSGWLRDENYCDADDQPKALPLRGESGSFEALVARYGGDVTMGSILEELQRVGAVAVSDANVVSLSHHAFIPDASVKDKVDILSTCTSDLLNTAAHNLDTDTKQARFQRQVIFYQVPVSIAADFQKYSNKRSLKLLLDYNRWLGEKLNRDSSQSNEATKRIGVGIYYFENDN
jgi:hypothetical protein